MKQEAMNIEEVIGARNSCKYPVCKKGKCFWCNFIPVLTLWFVFRNWYKEYSDFLRGKVEWWN